MPAWSFHIKLASEVSAVLNLDEQEKNLFILSNLIPDIKSGFLIPMDKPVWSKYSHYYIYKDELSLPDLEKYKNIYWDIDGSIMSYTFRLLSKKSIKRRLFYL